MLKATAILAATLLAIPTSAQAAGWNFPEANTVPSGSTMAAVNEPNTFDQWNRWQSAALNSPLPWPEGHICPSGPDTANCDPSKFRLEATSLLPYCAAADQENCIEGLAFIDLAGKRINAVFTKQIGGQTYPGIPVLNLVGGTSVSLWNAEGVSHVGGTTYAVAAKLSQIFDGSKYRARGININIVPSTIRPSGEAPFSSEQVDSTGINHVYTRHDANCTWAENGGCGIAEDFNPDYRVELTLRITNQITGWFRGRLKSPDASITKFSATANKMVVSGAPVTVPRMAALATKETTSERGVEILKNSGGKNPTAPVFSGNSIKDFWSNQGKQVFEVIDEFRLAAKDTAAGTSVLWNFSTVQAANNKCLADTSKVLGFVTTNATGYSGEAPTFENGSLNYDVAGLHYAPDGSLNQGSYDLMMRSDVARCLYGFAKTPLSASVSVVNEKGAKTTATSVVSEKNGWLKMAAYGFTFSNNTIKVKITKKAVKKVVRKK